MPSPYEMHRQGWQECTRCPLHAGRTQVVFFRGKIPCDVLLIGEAPGQSEDVVGQPFVGPAGALLDKIVGVAIPDLRWAMYNVCGCFPAEAKKTDKHEPPDEAIRACAPKLSEFVALARPRLIVTVGSLARDWLDPKRKVGVKALRSTGRSALYDFVDKIPQVSIRHPASLLPGRMPLAQSGLELQRCVVTIQSAVREFLTDHPTSVSPRS